MSLKVFDFQCDLGHVFEGWFASEENYQAQLDGGHLSCPLCNSGKVTKKLSAPRINLGHAQAPAGAVPVPAGKAGPARAAPVAAPTAGALAQMQADVLRHIRKIVSETENVGPRFADEARRMHDGEARERAIRGTATDQEREELAEEGIAIMPIPDFLDDDRLQ
jgi:hypothetical protein